MSFRRLSRDDEFYEIWWLLYPWIASISETTGFVGYYRDDCANSPTLIRFLDGKIGVYELTPAEFLL